MEKFSEYHSKSELFFNSIVKSLSEELTGVLSENIDRGWFADYVYASVTIDEVLYEIEYHPYRSEKTNLVIMKPNNNDQLQNIESRILSLMDFCTIENEAYRIYNESFA